jgi:hypothetical protein
MTTALRDALMRLLEAEFQESGQMTPDDTIQMYYDLDNDLYGALEEWGRAGAIDDNITVSTSTLLGVHHALELLLDLIEGEGQLQ